MLSKPFAYGLALAAGLALTSAARAGDDVIRLAPPKQPSGDVRTLGATADDLATENLEAYYRGYGGYRGGYGGYRGFYGGGYRGFYGGGYRGGFYGAGFNRGFYGAGFRGGYYGGYRGFYGGGFRGGYYGGYYSQPYYYSNYYSYPSYYGGYYGYACSDVGGAEVYPICSQRTVVVVRQPANYSVQPQQPPLQTQPQYNPTPIPQMPRADEEGTFPYDGGPKTPVPMPQTFEDARPSLLQRPRPQSDETVVSLKPQLVEEKKSSSSGKWNFPAYGEAPTRSK
jgi:hypothetical protein